MSHRTRAREGGVSSVSGADCTGAHTDGLGKKSGGRMSLIRGVCTHSGRHRLAAAPSFDIRQTNSKPLRKKPVTKTGVLNRLATSLSEEGFQFCDRRVAGLKELNQVCLKLRLK